MFADLPAAVRAEICRVLEWFAAHPRGQWDDMGALKDVYDEWWDVIHGKSALVDHPLIVLHSSTMQTTPRLSADGRLALQGQRDTSPEADTSRDRGGEGENGAAATGPSPTPQPQVNDPEESPAVDWQALLLSPPLSAGQIAERLGQPRELVERTLRHFRKAYDYGFVEDEDAGAGEARFRYKMSDVLTHLQKWYLKRQKKGD
jgi:hypothetical protein